MRILIAALGLLTIGSTMASAQDWRRYEERRYERRYYPREDCGHIRRSILILENMIRTGREGGGTRQSLSEQRAKYYRYCR